MFFLKYIIFAIAIMSTMFFINSIIASIVAGPSVFFTSENQQNDNVMKMAGIRVILILIMGFTWPLVFML